MAARLNQHGFCPRFVSRTTELSLALPECAWLLIGRPPRIEWNRAHALRLLQVAGAGVDPLFPAVGLPEQVRIANTRGVQAHAVRDHALALLLAFARGLPEVLVSQSVRRWSRTPLEPLTGKVLTVLGFGAIGSLIVEAARAFGMRVRVLCRSPRIVHDVDGVGTGADLDAMLAGADYVVVTLPLTSATRHLIDARALEQMPAHACLIDVSRGGVVDHRALEGALRAHRLRGAALDVFEEEPLPADSPLWSCPRLLITPHVGGFTPDYLERTLDVFLENVELVKNGNPPRTAVSREQEY